jgi:3-phosphoshikimate 1-carboxyvinyltransferase
VTPEQDILSGPASCGRPARALRGDVTIPGDKSISHRSLMLGAVALGKTHITGLLEGDDVLATARAMQAFGAHIARNADGSWDVEGRGLGNFISPDQPVDFGNAGTGCRLTMGLITGSPCTVTLIGDTSLSKRPMQRVLNPLRQMGLGITPDAQDHLPLTLTGPERPTPLHYRLPVASAQVKSAILLAGLSAPGETCVIEPHPTRDHTERMLTLFGANIETTVENDGVHVRLRGEKQLRACQIDVPGDPSSAAFPAIAALLVPGSCVTIRNVMRNPHREGLFTVLERMGADIAWQNQRQAAGEMVADLSISATKLEGLEVEARIAPSMIDEYPALAMVAAAASGKSIFHGLGELRVKESDRLAAICDGLRANGIVAEIAEDSLIVYGHDIYGGGVPPGGGRVATHHDHRIAMSFLLLGLASKTAITVDDISMIATSFPNFIPLMQSLGVAFTKGDNA